MIFLPKGRVYTQMPLDFNVGDIQQRPEPRKVLMVTPEYFDIVDVKNTHMQGQKGMVDKQKASEQWEYIRSHYQSLVNRTILDEFLEIPGARNCEDMVFAANQTFPWITDRGEKVVILSKMKHPSRQREVEHFEKFFLRLGYKVLSLNRTRMFEGMGDTIPHPGRKLIYGGYGHRSDKEAYEEISELLNVPVVCLELKDERFYHLDTCFVPLDEKSVMLYKAAFTEEGLKLIHALFEKVLDIPAEEAAENFALNAHVINDSKNKEKIVLLQKGSITTTSYLKDLGFEIIEADTSEYMKSGGSVFCMKMMVY